MDLYAPTKTYRATLTQEARVIVPALPSGSVHWHPSHHRKVQLLIPESPAVFFGLDVHPDALGPNRFYKLPEWPPGAPIEFKLLAGQWIVGVSEVGLAAVSVLIEYRRDRG